MTNQKFRFPRAFMSISREELSNVELTVRDAQGQPAKLPEDLRGHVFIIAFAGTPDSPPPKERPNGAVPAATVMPGAGGGTALFNGDGIAYRLDFHQPPERSPETGKAWLTAQLIKTPAFFADKITHNSHAYEDLRFVDVGIARFSVLGLCNQINTAFVPVKVDSKRPPRLLVTNDVNRPYEIDPRTLKIVAPIGNLNPPAPDIKSVWPTIDAIPGVFEFLVSSAHPTAAFSSEDGKEKGELFMISSIKTTRGLLFRPASDRNPGDKGKVFLLRWSVSPDGTETLNRWEVKHYNKSENREQSTQILQSTHMLGITENYVILVDTAMKTEQIETVFLIVVNLFSAILTLLKSLGAERHRRMQALEGTFKILRRLLKMAVIRPREVIEPLSVAIDKQFQEMPLASVTLKKPVGAALELIEQELEKPEDTEEPPLEVRLTTSYTQRFDPEAEVEPELSNTAKPNSFVTSVRRARQTVTAPYRAVRNWLIDRFIKRLKLRLSAQQNENTTTYIVSRSQLDTPEALEKQEIIAQRIEVPGAFAHFLTDYQETQNGEIAIVAPMTDALDPGEFIDRYDRPQLLRNPDIDDLSGMLPLGMDSNSLALIKINPKLDESDPNFCQKAELTFDKIQKDSKYLTKEIYQKYRKDPLYLGLYAYRHDTPQMTDIYVVQGGGWPELLTEFIYDLYKGYGKRGPRKRKISLKELKQQVAEGIPMIVTHVKISRDDQTAPLRVMQTYEADPGLMIFSLQFVPRPQSRPDQGDEGYLLCTMVHTDHLYSHSSDSPEPDWSDNSEIWIFDAKRLAAGPQYKLSHPNLNLGMTLHSTWLEEMAPAPANDYSFEQDYGPRIDKFINNYVNTVRRDSAKEEAREALKDLFKQISRDFESHR